MVVMVDNMFLIIVMKYFWWKLSVAIKLVALLF